MRKDQIGWIEANGRDRGEKKRGPEQQDRSANAYCYTMQNWRRQLGDDGGLVNGGSWGEEGGEAEGWSSATASRAT